MKIAIDVMGGDNAPDAVVEGCAMALSKLGQDASLVLFGEERALQSLTARFGLASDRVELVAAGQRIGCLSLIHI